MKQAKAVTPKAKAEETPAPEQLAKAIEDAAKKIVDEKDKKELINGLVSIGAKELTDPQSDNAIAFSKTFRFYPNLKFYRPHTGKYGTYPKDLSKGMDTEITDEAGNKTTFKAEEGLYPKYLQNLRKKLYTDIYGAVPRDKKLYSEVLQKLNRTEIKTIARIWKNMYGESLLSAMDNEWTNTAEIREFSRKFSDILK